MKPSICIISGRYPRTDFSSPINHKAYAARHGYTYIHCNWPTGAENPYMNKFRYLLEYVQLFDWIFWIDDDAFFIDLDQPLDSFIPQGDKILSACKSPDNKEIFTFLSSGQFLLRGGEVGEKFVHQVLNTPISMVENWWNDDVGYFTGGDQDVMIFLLHTVKEYHNAYTLHDYHAFNSRYEDFKKNPIRVFILHFTGRHETKLANYQKTMQLAGMGPTLLTTSNETGITRAKPLPMPTMISRLDDFLRPFLRRIKRNFFEIGVRK